MDGEAMTQDWYSEEMATFGDRLSAARDAADLSQEDLAQQVGVELDSLQAWEDDHREPRANRLSMLAGLLGVSLSWLLTGEGEGLDAPSESGSSSPDVSALLADVRDVQAQMSETADRLARLEKRLRGLVKS